MRASSILCIGTDRALLKTRCAVLTHAGYESSFATTVEVPHSIKTRRYDLVILSAGLTEVDKAFISQQVSDAIPIISLTGFVFARELLSMVHSHLVCPAKLEANSA